MVGFLHHLGGLHEQLHLLLEALRLGQLRYLRRHFIRAASNFILLLSESGGAFEVVLLLQCGLCVLSLAGFITQLHLIEQDLHHLEHDFRRQTLLWLALAFAFTTGLRCGDHLFGPTIQRISPILARRDTPSAPVRLCFLANSQQRSGDLRLLHLIEDVLETHVLFALEIGFQIALNQAHHAAGFRLLGSHFGGLLRHHFDDLLLI